MKKLFFALMAVATMTLASCLGKTETPGTGDPQAEAPSEVKDLPTALGNLLKNGDGEGLFALVGNIQEKALSFIKDNPQKAQEYLQTAQQFLKDNAAKISEVVGKIANSDMAERAQELIKSVSEQPVDQLLGLVGIAGDQLNDAAGAANDAVEGAVEGAVDAAGNAVDAAKEAVGNAVEGAKDAVGNAVEGAKDAAGQAVEGAKKAANDAVDNAAQAAKKAVGGLVGE